jgi:polyisoprenoid-binding protein YceI
MLKYIVAFFALAAAALPAAAQTYNVDPRHTHITWAVSRLGALTFRGKLVRNSGKVVLDAGAGKGEVEILFDMRGQVTGNELDANLMIASLFNVAKFPTASFKSNKFAFKDQSPTSIEGELTLLGVTKPVTLTVTQFRCGEHPMTRQSFCGADATATIKRSDWGMTSWISIASDEVKLDIAIEAYKQ